MQFNGNVNNLDLYSDTRFWCGIANTDTTLYPLVDFTRNANFGLDKVTHLIMRADNTWEWDDTNQSDLPIATAALVAGQADYSIPVTHLKILCVRVKNTQGDYTILEPINRRDLTNSQLNESDGMPRSYDKVGNSLFLHPAPAAGSVTLTAGLEVQYQRGASYFVYTDTTKTPGFATQFHRLISFYAALDYCDNNDMNARSAKLRAMTERMEVDLIDFYSSRDEDTKTTLTTTREDYGQDYTHG